MVNDRFRFVDNSTVLNASNLNKLPDSNTSNMLKNSYFESWGAGTSSAPDGWNFVTGTGGSVAQDSTQEEWGNYTARIIHTGSGTQARLQTRIIDPTPNVYYTCVARVNCNAANTARAFIYDLSSGYQYSDYHTGGGSMESLDATAQVSATAGYIECGVAIQAVSSTSYIDGIYLARGQVGPDYQPSVADQCPTCNGYDNDGSYVNSPGGIRIVPFLKTGNFTAGAAAWKTITITMVHGCNACLAAHADLYSAGAIDPGDLSCNCDNFTTTTFDVNCQRLSTTFAGSEAYVIKGHYIALGWDNYQEVYGS